MSKKMESKEEISNISELATVVAKRYSELLKELAKYDQVEGLSDRADLV